MHSLSNISLTWDHEIEMGVCLSLYLNHAAAAQIPTLTFTDQIPQTCVRIVKITSHHRTAYLNPIYLLHINWLTCNCLGGSECLYSAVPVLATCLVPGLGLGM